MTKAKQARADELGMSRESLAELYNELDYVKHSGIMNMYGAVPHLVRCFYVTRTVARKVLKAWMDDFS